MEWIKKNKGFLALIKLSGIWVIGVIWLPFSELSRESFYPRNISLNELGDYLAGAFSPIIFLWLIVGYFMQYNELKILNTQYTEDRKKLSPILVIDIVKPISQSKETSDSVYFSLSNGGASVTNVEVVDKDTDSEISLYGVDIEEKGTKEIYTIIRLNKDFIDENGSGSLENYKRKTASKRTKAVHEDDFKHEKVDANFCLTYLDEKKRKMSQNIEFSFSIVHGLIIPCVTLSPEIEYL